MSYCGIHLSLNKSKEELNKAVYRLRRAEIQDFNDCLDEIEKAAHRLTEEAVKAKNILENVWAIQCGVNGANEKLQDLIVLIGGKDENN